MDSVYGISQDYAMLRFVERNLKPDKAIIRQKHLTRVVYSPVDIHLWPALLQLWFGTVKKTAANSESSTDAQLFE